MLHDSRLATGIPGLDEILNGGLIAGRSYLLTGAAGTGKTIFSLQWLRSCASYNASCLYITLAEPKLKIQQNVQAFGWDLKDIEIADLSGLGKPTYPRVSEYHVFAPSEVESTPIWEMIYKCIKNKSPKCLVIDSVTKLRHLATDEYQFRQNISELVGYLSSQNITSLLLFEPTILDQDVSVALAVDGVIRLHSEISKDLAIGVRSVQVDKLRSSDFMSGYHPLRIGEEGIRVFPHRIEKAGLVDPGKSLVSSGIERLDELLCGGLESGTTTLVTGPAGTGKSTLGVQYLAHYAKDKKGILFTFEEPESFIVYRSARIGTPLDELISQGRLKIVRLNPLEQYPDEFLAAVRHEVETEQRSMVVIDSLRGYQFAMEEFGMSQAHIHNLITYLSSRGVTTMLMNEQEYITGANLRATDLGISHLADNIILLRYAEKAGEIIKVLCCLKKRLGNFQPELRQIKVGKEGLAMSEKLRDLQGILSGAPLYVPTQE